MASRCINALNELDAISDKIFYKYSKNRLKQDITNEVRDSKSRSERNTTPITSSKSEQCVSRKSNYTSQSVSNISTSTKNSSTNSNVRKKPLHRPKSQCTYKKPQKSHSLTREKVNSETSVAYKTNAPPSIYGKFTPGATTHKTGKWFNLKEGVNQGSIDSFECDKLKEKALCYKVDLKESKSVPKLLHHRLEVRIGRNGHVMNEDITEKIEKTNDGREEKSISRIAPLSWEEQLNWKNTQVVQSRTPNSKENKVEDGLCETHPVIFNPDSSHQKLSKTTNISNKASQSYKLYMDKKLVNDRRNLTCGLKCVTSVQLEDGGARKFNADAIKRTKSHDSDIMDMSNTIQNMETIYRTFSQESEKKYMYTPEKVKNTNDNEGNQDTKTTETESIEEQTNEKVKINKKVSFKDDINGKLIKVNGFRGKDSLGEATERNSPLINRPNSSKARPNITNHEYKVDKPKRPYTAPHSTPRTTDNLKEEIESPLHSKHLVSILVPTSNFNEAVSENETDHKNEPIESQEHDIHIKLGCKSAPNLHNAEHEFSIQRSLSSTSARIKTEKYTRPQRNLVLDESDSGQLPPNLPPGQALIELRKKVRENLAKETADLQLDIQQLYIKHHSYRN